MVVPVLITSCHVSEKPKSGPLIAHTKTTPAARIKVDARPAASDVLLARSPKNFDTLEGSLACFLLLMSVLIANRYGRAKFPWLGTCPTTPLSCQMARRALSLWSFASM